jgi:exodeoxyribonuclease-3
MKIISWNVNGIRALERSGHFGDVFEHDPDVLCLQETKAEAKQLSDSMRNVTGFHAHFASSTRKKGYSGVGVYTKTEPTNVGYGIAIEKFDEEGRVLELDFDTLTLFNVYFPNGGRGPDRLAYKLDFYDAFLEHIEKRRAQGQSIIFCGDVNTAHEEIDLARPKENESNSGFLPEERAWIDEVINLGYIDTFRHMHPNKTDVYSYWDIKTRARDRNVGWRIDYVFISPDLRPRLKSAFILQSVFGSDHCPVGIELM